MKTILYALIFILCSGALYAQRTRDVLIAARDIKKGAYLQANDIMTEARALSAAQAKDAIAKIPARDFMLYALEDIPQGARFTTKNTAAYTRAPRTYNKLFATNFRLYPLRVQPAQYAAFEQGAMLDIIFTGQGPSYSLDGLRLIKKEIHDGENIFYIELDSQAAQYLFLEEYLKSNIDLRPARQAGA
ncbi:MAG: hypothetical protein LBR90_03235 [Elusimicrobiota bacterium]|jgi:hypothetical protein|nr:hypothetical protein [Elusimicrobiota bacterium]